MRRRLAGPLGLVATLACLALSPLSARGQVTWTIGSSPAGPVWGYGAAQVNDGLVLVAGGFDAAGFILASTLLYNATGGISAGPSMNVARVGHMAIALGNGKVLIVGGSGDGSVELFDLASGGGAGSFTLLPIAWPRPRLGVQATALADGKVLFTGGYLEGADFEPLPWAELYDPDDGPSGSFAILPSMSKGRTFHTATRLIDGRVLIAGGLGDGPDTAEIFDPATLTFSTPIGMGASRSDHTAVRLGDGRVLVSGGVDGADEVFLPSTESFGPVGAPVVSRLGHALVLLPTGRVLALGGWYNFATAHVFLNSSTTELFDPRTNTSALTEPPRRLLEWPFYANRAWLMQNGKVLTLGLNSEALLYTPDPARAYIGNTTGGTVEVIDGATGTSVMSVDLDLGPHRTAVSLDGTAAYAITQGAAATLAAIDTSDHSVTSVLTSSPPGALGVSPDGTRVYVALTAGPVGSVVEHNAAGLGVVRAFAGSPNPVDLAVNPSGTKLYVTHDDATLAVVDLGAESTQLVSLAGAGAPAGPKGFGVGLTPDGQRVLVADAANNHLIVLGAADNTVLARITGLAASARGLAVHPDGRRVYVASEGLPAQVSVVDLVTGVVTLIPVSQPTRGVSVSPDGRQAWFLASAGGGYIRLDTETGEVKPTLAAPPTSALGRFFGVLTSPEPADADLSVVVTPPATATVGEEFVYEVTVTNNGPDTAAAVLARVTVSAGAGAVTSITVSPGDFEQEDVNGNEATLGKASLAPGESATFHLELRAGVTGNVTVSVTAATFMSDAVPANDTDEATVTVQAGGGGASANVSVNKTGATSLVAGTNLTYTLAVSNAGPDTAAGVTVNDTLPASVTFVSVTPSQGSCPTQPAPGSTGTVSCALGSLSSGANATIALVVHVPAAGTGFIIDNTATVTATTTDPASGNNSSTASTTVTATSITGRVTQVDGVTPIAGARVETQNGPTFASVQTNSSGQYAFGGLVPGSYVIRAEKSGFATRWYGNASVNTQATPVNVVTGTVRSGIDIALPAGAGGLAGRIADGSGIGIGNAEVWVWSGTSIFLFAIRADGAGNYDTGQVLDPGTYKVLANAPGKVTRYYNAQSNLTSANLVAVASGATTTGIDITLAGADGGLSGTVTDGVGGAGVLNANVAVLDTSNRFLYNDLTDAAGFYDLTNRLATGNYKIRVRAPGFVTQYYNGKPSVGTADLLAIGTANVAVNVALVRGGTVRGQVTNAATGAPLAGATVEFFDAATGAIIEGGYGTATDGTYTTDGRVPAGTYKVRARLPGFIHTFHAAGVDLRTATSVTVTAEGTVTGVDVAMPPGGTLSGRVRQQGTLTPIAGATVSVSRLAANTFQGVFTVTTDSSGNWTIQGLRDGDWWVRASAAGHVLGYYSGDPDRPATDTGSATYVTVSGASATAAVDINLAPGGGILSGTVSRSDGTAPPAGTQVRLRGLAPRMSWNGFVVNTATATGGGYTFTGVPAGEYVVEADGQQVTGGTAIGWYPTGSTSWNTAVPVAVAAGATVSGVNFSLPVVGAGIPPRTISGVVTSGGAPLQFVQIGAVDAVSLGFVRFTTVNGDGTYTLDQLRPGRYLIRASTERTYETRFYPDAPLQSMAMAVDVTATSQSGIDLALSPTAATVAGMVTRADTGEAVMGAQIGLRHFLDNTAGGATTRRDGSFLVRGVTPGSYLVRATGLGLAIRFHTASGPAGATMDDGSFVTVAAGAAVTGKDIALPAGAGTIRAGATLAGGAPAVGVIVQIVDFDSAAGVTFGFTDATGVFEVPSLGPGRYGVRWTTLPGYELQWYSGARSLAGASAVLVSAGTTTDLGAAAVLAPGQGAIGGRIFAADGVTPIAGAGVIAFDPTSGGYVARSSITRADGRYLLSGLPLGPYHIQARALGSSRQYFDGVPDAASATLIDVTGVLPDEFNFNLAPSSDVAGTISYAGAQTGPLHVRLFRVVSGVPRQVYETVIPSPAFPQAYGFRLPPPDTQGVVPGTYYLSAFIDSGPANGAPDPGEPAGIHDAAIVVGAGASVPVNVTLSDGAVAPANAVPTAQSRTVNTLRNTAVDITLGGADAETPEADFTFAVVTPPASGALDPGTRVRRYTPAAGFTGTDTFTFTVTDRGSPDGCGAPGPACAAPATSQAGTITVVVLPEGGTVTTALTVPPPLVSAPSDGPAEISEIQIVEQAAGQMTPSGRVQVLAPTGVTFAGVPGVSVDTANGLAIVTDGPEAPRREPGNGAVSFAIATPSSGAGATVRLTGLSVNVATNAVPAGLAQQPLTMAVSGAGVTPASVHAATAVAAGGATPQVGAASIGKAGAGAQGLVVVLTGVNFQAGATVTFGPGVNVISTVVDSPTQITVVIDVSSGAQPGPRSITVTNPGGQSVTLANQFEVTAAPSVTASDRRLPALAGEECVTGPLCTNVKNQRVNISGSGFSTPFTVVFGGVGITVVGVGLDSASAIWADVDVDEAADLASRTVSVINPDGGTATSAGPIVDLMLPPPDAPTGAAARGSRTQAAPAPPGLTGVTPAAAPPGASVVLAGAFGTRAAEVRVNFAGPSGTRVAAAVTAFSSTSITATVPATAADGPVTVTNTKTGLISPGIPFAILVPKVTGVIPRQVTTGTSADLVIAGTKLAAGATVTFSPAAGITITGPMTLAPDGSLRFPILVATGAAAGARGITVTNPAGAGGGSATLANALEIVPPAAAELQLSLPSLVVGAWLPSLEAVSVTFDGAGKCTGKVITPRAVPVRATFASLAGLPAPASVTFSIVTSARPGTATNEDCEPVPATPGNDFSIGTGDARTLSTTVVAPGPTYDTTLFVFDMGGKVTITASATLATGAQATGTLALPVDTDGDDLPDAYEGNTALNGTALNLLSKDQDGNGKADWEDRFARDGLSNFEKYRGIFRSGPGNTGTGGNAGSGPVSDHARLGANRRHFFVRGRGFGDDPIIAANPGTCGVTIEAATRQAIPAAATAEDLAWGCPLFDVGAAFATIGVQVHNVSGAYTPGRVFPRRSMQDQTKATLDLAEIVYEAVLCQGGEVCEHTSKFGVRQWVTATLGYSAPLGTASSYASRTSVYKKAIDSYFRDRPYQHRTNDPTRVVLGPGGVPLLAPITKVGDNSKAGADNGQAEAGEPLGNDNQLAGDTYVRDRFDLDLSVMDTNNDGCVELPLATDPTTLSPCDPRAISAPFPQATKQQVVRHIVTHELAHAAGAPHNSTNRNDVMYDEAVNWIRDGFFAPETAALIRIHNKGMQ